MQRFLSLLTLCLGIAASVFAAGQPIDITSAKLEVRQSDGVAVFSGNVTIMQNGLVLTAPKVEATYAAQSDGGLRSVTASGGVVIVRNGQGGIDEKATGTTAVFEPQAEKLVLTGNVTLTRGPSELSGDKLVYDMKSGNAVVTNSKGPVKARFIPKN